MPGPHPILAFTPRPGSLASAQTAGFAPPAQTAGFCSTAQQDALPCSVVAPRWGHETPRGRHRGRADQHTPPAGRPPRSPTAPSLSQRPCAWLLWLSSHLSETPWAPRSMGLSRLPRPPPGDLPTQVGALHRRIPYCLSHLACPQSVPECLLPMLTPPPFLPLKVYFSSPSPFYPSPLHTPSSRSFSAVTGQQSADPVSPRPWTCHWATGCEYSTRQYRWQGFKSQAVWLLMAPSAEVGILQQRVGIGHTLQEEPGYSLEWTMPQSSNNSPQGRHGPQRPEKGLPNLWTDSTKRSQGLQGPMEIRPLGWVPLSHHQQRIWSCHSTIRQSTRLKFSDGIS